MILRQTPHPTFSEWGSRGCDTGQQAPRGAAQRTWQESEGSVQAPRQLRALPAGHPHPPAAAEGPSSWSSAPTAQRASGQGASRSLPLRGLFIHPAKVFRAGPFTHQRNLVPSRDAKVPTQAELRPFRGLGP